MIKKLSLFFILLVLFANCKNEKTNDSKTASATPSVTSSSKGFYKHFKGTIDAFPITMDLVQVSDNPTDHVPNNFSGHYYYDKYQEPISLYGEVDSTGNIVLHEDNKQDKDIYFIGKIDASGNFAGTWRDTSSKRELAFSLKETNTDGALAFDFYNFSDSIKLWKDKPKTPMATFDIELLLPSKNTEGGVAAFLKDRILGSMNNDTIEKSYTNISVETLQKNLRDTFFKSYLETVAGEQIDTTEEVPFSYNYGEASAASVLFNEKDLLSMAYSTYSYSGGAHGNHATSVASYDLAQKKVLKLTDIFLPKFEKTLNSALAKAVRREFNLKPNEPLSNSLFDNSISYNTNFCITKKGIIFLYNPYEIAAYAYGEIELFIPFEEIKTIVNPRFLQ